MMKKLRTSLVALLMMAISPGIMAQLNETKPERFEEATEETAKQFVSGYYSHLKRGMSRSHLITYYNQKMMEKHDAVIMKVGEKTKGDLVFESQRLLDIDMMNARCEELINMDVNVYGLTFRKAKLNYRVIPKCASWKKESQREVSLKYIIGEKMWVISKIEEVAN